MPRSYDVTFPKSKVVRYPDKCVSCGKHEPGSLFRESTFTTGWWTWFVWVFGQRFTADVPACEPCCKQMRNQRWRRRFVNLVFIIAGVLIAASLLQWYRGPLKKWLAMGIALVFITPLLIWERYYPRPFELTADGDTVDYEFLNLEYAAEFSVLNEENDDVDDSDPLPG